MDSLIACINKLLNCNFLCSGGSGMDLCKTCIKKCAPLCNKLSEYLKRGKCDTAAIQIGYVK